MKYEVGDIEETLFDSLLDTMDLVGRNKQAINDVTRRPLTYGQFIAAAFVLGKQIAKQQKSGEMTGVLLPNMTATVVTFFGMRAFNITPCMLNSRRV